MDAHQETDRRIAEMVRACYWDRDINCARTTLYCMSRLFDLPLDPQLDRAAIGLNGAGRMGCQCGLLEGALLFLGIHASFLGKRSAASLRGADRGGCPPAPRFCDGVALIGEWIAGPAPI